VRRTVRLALWIGLGGILSIPAVADDPVPVLGFAFSHYTGSGIYVVENRTVQVYDIPISFSPMKLEEHKLGLRVTLPVSLGFYDFEVSDVVQTGLPEHLGTASFLPGIRFDFRPAERWILGPFVEAGAAKDFEGGELVLVGGTGIDSQVTFLDSDVVGLVRNRLVAATSRAAESDERESYQEFRTSVEMSFLLPMTVRGRATDLTGFGAAYVFHKPPEQTVTRLLGEPLGADETWVQWEVGVTFGTRPKAKWWKIPVPRFGLSYRFGDGEDAVRIVFGAPF
jgi:hypothetical protein